MIIKGYAVFCDNCELEWNTFCQDAAIKESVHHYTDHERHHPFVTEVNFHIENAYADRVSMSRRRIASKITGASN